VTILCLRAISHRQLPVGRRDPSAATASATLLISTHPRGEDFRYCLTRISGDGGKDCPNQIDKWSNCNPNLLFKMTHMRCSCFFRSVCWLMEEET